MKYLTQIQNLINETQEFYDSWLQQFSKEIVSIYKNYPYLLIILIILVPLIIFCVLWSMKKIFSFLQAKKEIIDISNPYFKSIFSLVLWYSSNSLYRNVYISLEEQFEFYEKFIFSISLAFSNALIFIEIVKLFTINAYEQFNSVLKRNSDVLKNDFHTLKKYSIFYLTFYYLIADGLGWKTIGFWVGAFGLIHITRLSGKNRGSFASILEYLFGKIRPRIESGLLGPFRLISFLLMLFMALIYRIVFSLSFFEFTKKLAAKIIRQQVERVSGHDSKVCEVPKFYTDSFEKLDLVEYRPKWINEIQEQILDSISEWEEDPINESFIHLVGDPGTGRNALIDEIEKKYAHLNPLKIRVPKKISNKENFLSFISSAVKNVDQEEDDGKARYKLVIFNNAENFYLNTPGGFDALKEMFRIVNRSENSFFWINVFDYYPWMHIEDFFGHVHHRQKFVLKGFSDNEIRKLILTKNKTLKTEIVYDRAIHEATNKKGSKDREDNVSTHFFRMIWEQSNGNPKMAQELWLKSIKYFSEKENRMRVGLPERNKVTVLRDQNIDTLFVYNSLLKHTRMTFEECCLATNLPARVVRFALIFGQNEKFLMKDKNHNYSISRDWYGTLSDHLKAKNLIYG